MASKKDRRERKRGVRREGRHAAEARQHQRGGEWNPFETPEGVSIFKPEKNKTYHVDILPNVAGKYNKACNPGDEMYVLTYPVYRSLGIEERSYIAIQKLLGVKDPVHEHFLKLRKDGAIWDDMKAFSPAERQLWLVFVHEQAEAGLQLYDASFQTFGKLLTKEIEDAGEETWVDNFDDIDGGATIKVRFAGEQVGQNTWVKADKITFIEREDGFTADGDKKLCETILDQLEDICLDDLLKIPDYATLKAALEGEPIKDTDEETDKKADGKKSRKPEPEEEPPAKKKATKKAEPEEEEEEPPAKKKTSKKAVTAEDLGIEKGGIVTHEKHGECIVLRVAGDGLTVSIKDDDGNVHRDIDPLDLEPVEGSDDDIPFKKEPEEEDEPPVKKKTSKKPEPEEDDDDAPKKPAKAGTNKNEKGNWDDW